MSFIELHARSAFNFLRGASSPEEMVTRAAELGQSAIAILDRNGLRPSRYWVTTDDLVIMAIVNRTPDSFYDKGATFSDPAALDAVARAVDNGADIIDIGGVKAGPGAAVDAAEEIRRTASLVAEIRSRYDVVISVDTWRAEVGRVVCAEGADLMNDAWGGYDPGLAEVAAEFKEGVLKIAIPKTAETVAKHIEVTAA